MSKKSFAPLEVSSLKRRRSRLLTGFTLLELMLVVVIVGIIATFAIPGYLGVRQRAEGRQASTQLRLIHTAEKVIFLEENAYRACTFPLPAAPAAFNCNVRLNLDLPDDGWTYTVTLVGPNNFVATAVRAVGASWCVYNIDKNMDVPNFSPACVYHP